MANADLTAQELRELLDYDPNAGIFTRKVKRNKWHQGQQAGGVDPHGYVSIGLNYKRYAAHRLAWLHYHGEWPGKMLDHINGNRADNRICNLRNASPSINSENQRRARSDNKSCGLLGVSRHLDGRWRAKITHKRRTLHIGLYMTPEEAHDAYIAAKRLIHEGCSI